MATIKDVAKLAGVSHGTVSNVLNGKKVLPDKIEKVESAIKALGYRPNVTARSLKTSRTMNVGVVVPTINDLNFSHIFTGIERVLFENGYTANMYITSEIPAKETVILEQVIQQNMDGVIIATCRPDNTEAFISLETLNIPVVFIEREVSGERCNFVGYNNYRSVYDSTVWLLSRENSGIVLITGPKNYYSEAKAIEGYLNALDNSRISLAGAVVLETNLDKESSFKAAAQYLRANADRLPEGIICTSTQILESVFKALTILNLEDRGIDIISLGEDSWIPPFYGDAIIIPRPAINLGETAADLLIRNLKNPFLHENTVRILDNKSFGNIVKDKYKANITAGKTAKEIRILMLKGTSADATETLLPDFCKLTGVKPVIHTFSYQDLYQHIVEESGKGCIDVFQVDIPWLPEFARDNLISELNTYIEAEPSSTADFIPGVLEKYSRFEGRYYALPYMFGTQLLFYRKDIFEDRAIQQQYYNLAATDLNPPQTWKEYNTIARFFTRKYNPLSPVEFGTTLGGAFSNGAVCEFLPRMWAYGGRLLDETMNTDINRRETLLALENYIESYSYASGGSIDHLWDEQVEEFAQGRAAMMILFVAHATELMDRKKSEVVGKVGSALVPGGSPTLGGWSLGINQNSGNKDEAWEFIRWATCRELAIPYTILGGATPSINLYKSSELLSIYPWLPKALESFRLSKKREISKVTTDGKLSERDFELTLGKYIYKAIKDEMSAEEALKSTEDELKKLTRRRT